MVSNLGMPNKVFAFEVLTDPNIKLVALTGKAGTGKHCWLWQLPLVK